MVALASAFVRLRPDPNKAEFAKTGKEMGDTAGKAAGESFGTGYTRGSDGKLRDSRGKFVKDSEAMGTSAGGRAGDGFASGFGKGSGKISGAIKSNLSLAAGVFVPLGLAAAVGAIGKIGIAYEDNLNIFKSVTKATGQQMDVVADKARALGSDITLPGVSAAGAAEAMTELAKAGFSVEQSMDAAKATLQLARIANISEGEAAEIAANAVNAFGISAKDTTFVVDELAAAANSSSIEVTEASQSFKQAAAVFSGLQGPAVGGKEAITELNTAIAILGNNGIKGSDAGTSLKQALLQLTAPAGPAKAAMIELAQAAMGANITLDQQNDILYGNTKAREKAINAIDKMNPALANSGDIAYDAAGKMRSLPEIIDLVTRGTAKMTQEDRNAAITKIFGADATRAILALMKGGLPTYEAQRKAIMEQGAAADFAKAKNAGLGGAIDNVKSQFENAAISIYNVVKGPLTEGLNGIANALPAIFAGIGTFGTFVGQNIDVIRDWAVAIGAVTLALRVNSALLAINAAGGLIAYIKGIQIITTTTKLWAGAQALLNASLLANPIGVAIVALTALVAVIVLAYRHSETFRAIVQTVWSAIKTAIKATVDWIVGTAWPAIKAAWDGIASAALWLWHNVIEPAWHGIMAAVNVAVTAVKAYIGFLVAEFNAVAAVATWLWRNIFAPVWAAISKIVQVAWLIIEVIFKAFTNYLRNVIAPALNYLWRNVFVPVFNAIKALISTWWTGTKVIFGLFVTYVVGPLRTALTATKNFFVTIFNAVKTTISNWWTANVKPIFTAVSAAWRAVATAFSNTYNSSIRPLFQRFTDFIRNTVVKGFDTAVTAIGKAWDRVKEIAKKPVTFVVKQVINPFIRGLNKVAGAVGVKDRVEEIGGFARGGQIPGAPSRQDNRLAVGPAGPIKVASGEWINRTASTLHNLPLLKRVNSLNRSATMGDLIDVVPDGYAHGGMMGDGIGDFFGKLVKGAKTVGSAITNPKAAAQKVANAALDRIPGAGMLVNIVRGMGKKIIDGISSFISDKLGGGGGIGGGSIAGGWRGMQQLISARFPDLHMISGNRPGARTLTGHQSYHALGRAVDYPPVRALAAWIKSTFGAKTKELITPWQDLNLHNGKPHTYTGAVWNQHNFAGGNAHVHWAAANGGLVGDGSGMPIKLFDKGGYWPSGTLGANMSGRTEYVDSNPVRSNDMLVDRLDRMIALLEQNPVQVADALASPVRRTVSRSRAGGTGR